MAKPIEAKVQAATASGLLIGVLITILHAVVGDAALVSTLPATAQTLIGLFGPPLAAFLGGYVAPHTPQTPPADTPPIS